jgi:excisionase family DNA binding protein
MPASRTRQTEHIDGLTPMAVSIRTVAGLLGVSERTVAAMIADRQLRSVLIRRRRLVPRDALEELLAAAE